MCIYSITFAWFSPCSGFQTANQTEASITSAARIHVLEFAWSAPEPCGIIWLQRLTGKVVEYTTPYLQVIITVLSAIPQVHSRPHRRYH
jgi:hypothetical protein